MIYADADRQAKLHYTASSFRILKAGEFVVCAVTGKRIALNSLRYWNHELQEAYADSVAATKRHQERTAS